MLNFISTRGAAASLAWRRRRDVASLRVRGAQAAWPGASKAWRRRRPLGEPPSTALPQSARRRSPARRRASLRARSARAVPTGAHVDGVALSEASCELGGSRAPRKPKYSLAGGRRPQISPSSPPIESTAPKRRVWRGQASLTGQLLPQSRERHKNRRPKRSDPKSARSPLGDSKAQLRNVMARPSPLRWAWSGRRAVKVI